tara:strand:+ start:1141 stop:1317 length:177 start_codon:yes stop_codon:yes gene_type:complete
VGKRKGLSAFSYFENIVSKTSQQIDSAEPSMKIVDIKTHNKKSPKLASNNSGLAKISS